ncbi:hypothetical protein [Paenibacillus hamazuiensis]|uniref:hypothetical protein n=1 Tax=Paenibacillus hamazuiensis TaxID=2936508 RepID=UPI00200DD5A6|nr:hypothetical protein [Paenibacillus hamazuiensis]
MFSNYDLHKMIKNRQAFHMEAQLQKNDEADPNAADKLERMKTYKLLCQLREIKPK